MKSLLALSIVASFALADMNITVENNTTNIQEESIKQTPSFIIKVNNRAELKKAVRKLSKGVSIKPEEREAFKEQGYTVLINDVSNKGGKTIKPKSEMTFDCQNTRFSDASIRPETSIKIKNCDLKNIEIISESKVNIVGCMGSVEIETDSNVDIHGGIMKKVIVRKTGTFKIDENAYIENLFIHSADIFDGDHSEIKQFSSGFFKGFEGFEKIKAQNIKLGYAFLDDDSASNFENKKTFCEIDNSIFIKGNKREVAFCSEGIITDSFIPSNFVKGNEDISFIHSVVQPQLGYHSNIKYINTVVNPDGIDCDGSFENSTVPRSKCPNSHLAVDFKGMYTPDMQPPIKYGAEVKADCENYPQLKTDFHENKRDCDYAWIGAIQVQK